MAPSQNKLMCAGCDVILRKTRGKKKLTNNMKDEAKAFSSCLKRVIVVGNILCCKCRLTVYRKDNFDKNLDSETETDLPAFESTSNDPTFEVKLKSIQADSEIEYVEIPMQRSVATHKCCCFCFSSNNIIVIPAEARTQCYIKKKIFIPAGNRCCKTHLIKNRIYEEDLQLLKTHSNTTRLTVSELSKVMETLSIKCDSTLLGKIDEFSLSEKQVQVFTGLSWENLLEIKEMMISMRNNQSRSVIQAIVVFLFKLRTGNSNKMLASILNIENEQIISDYSASVVKSFENDVLPDRFGLNSFDRAKLIQNHTTEIAKNLFDAHNNLLLICDGTYARHQKSTNNQYQRKSFSGQKKVHLCKPFTICTTDGYVMDILGSYLANQNDAEILKTIIEDTNGLCKFLEKDIFVLDRF